MMMTRISTTGIADEYSPAPNGHGTVLLLHAGVADRRVWDAQVSFLLDHFGVLRVDLRGFGDSSEGCDGWCHVADVVGVLDEAGAAVVHIVAASLGAGVGVQVALEHPARVRSLLIASPGGAMLRTMTPTLRAFFDAESQALAAGDVSAAVEANVSTWVVGPGRSEADVTAGVCDRVRLMQRRAFEVAPHVSDPVDQGDGIFEQAATLAVPTLMIVGEHDVDTCHDAAEQWCAAMPFVELEWWADAAHLPSMEHLARFNSRLERWLGEQQRA